MKRLYLFLFVFLFLIGCSSNNEMIVGQWRFVGSDSESQQKWSNAFPELTFKDDQTFSWKAADESGTFQTIEGKYSLRMRYNVYMKSNSESPGWNWEKGSNETIMVSGSTLKMILNKDSSQYLLFQKANKIDVPLAEHNINQPVGVQPSSSAFDKTSQTESVKAPNQLTSNVPKQTNSSKTLPTETNAPKDQVAQNKPAKNKPVKNEASKNEKTDSVQKVAENSNASAQQVSVQQSSTQQASVQESSAANKAANKASKKAIDLLAQIIPQKHFVNGYWQKKGQELIVPPTRWACLAFPVELPESYSLSIKLTRLSGESPFYIGLIVDKRPVVLKMNDQKPLIPNEKIEKSGFSLVQGKESVKNTIAFSEKIFDKNQSASIECFVEKNRIRVEINGQEVATWSGNLEDFQYDSKLWKNVPKNRGFIAAEGFGDFKIEKMDLF
ncbi:MAG: hypothetical protein Q4C95_09400 [Planctomycetia bacterium]|nr:hypothetical protein [Planctomycetia bacterium]